MPNEGERKGDSLSDNHLIQRKMRFTKPDRKSVV